MAQADGSDVDSNLRWLRIGKVALKPLILGEANGLADETVILDVNF